MAGPRLLDKKIVNVEVAKERKQQIDKGIALTKSVDAVRATFDEEKERLEQFRTATLKKVQSDIDAKISERDSLERRNKILREERVLLETPVDLTQKWDEVRRKEVENHEFEQSLQEKSDTMGKKEAELETSSERNERDRREIVRKDELAERNILESEGKSKKASLVLENAKKTATRLIQVAAKKEQQMIKRELAADERDRQMMKREKDTNAKESDLVSREKALKVRYQTFIKAQSYIKSKKK